LDPVDYYKRKFGQELLYVSGATRGSGASGISIVWLVPRGEYPQGFGGREKAFQKLVSKRLFLFCFFFSALIDQGIHSSLRSEHSHFDRLAKYPKFVGILGSAYTNLHPGLLLLLATLYIPAGEEKLASEEFQSLADFFSEDYCRFFHDEYPQITGRLVERQDQHQAIRKFLTELSNSTALLFIPNSLQPYSQQVPNLKLYENWMLYFSRKINSKLDEYEKEPNIC